LAENPWETEQWRRHEAGLPVVVYLDTESGEAWDDEGELADPDDEDAERNVVVYCDLPDALRDEYIDGSSWEEHDFFVPRFSAYPIASAILSVRNRPGWQDVVSDRLKGQGYDVRHVDPVQRAETIRVLP
jgi:hypothetical protein